MLSDFQHRSTAFGPIIPCFIIAKKCSSVHPKGLLAACLLTVHTQTLKSIIMHALVPKVHSPSSVSVGTRRCSSPQSCQSRSLAYRHRHDDWGHMPWGEWGRQQEGRSHWLSIPCQWNQHNTGTHLHPKNYVHCTYNIAQHCNRYDRLSTTKIRHTYF